ncbi:peptidylprolyl isomerase [Erythrobacter sp.]|uniref:peptidylprolyl isomerase n=1 Tax=Erythrobacter sp. TaxID=1042 RepID=UPI001425BDF9|nr:peptidylprolyl isomerase [Erythrobacter sp.]QIQ86555.1 MAG: peptidyl-prolyl cis-trans isomerase [Erythrobacter sp.]
MTLPGWTREPLIHFLALGFVLYVALTWGGEPVDPSSRLVEVDDARQAELALGFERVMGRAPTDAELDKRIEQYVREEILYREALRLGLDEGDAVVRQRLVAKMDMTASAAAETAEPDEAELRAFFEENRERYAGEPRVTFRQAFFDARAAAQEALSDPGSVGARGRSANLPARMERARADEVAARFGKDFAAALEGLAPGTGWQGPIASGLGWHLVRIEAREPAPESFADARQKVVNDWRSAEIAAREERAYAILRSAYRVRIDR